MTRRSLLAALAGAAACRPKMTRDTAPLPRPPFYWGVGIENCWMAQTNPAKDGDRRRLDVFEQMQHYEKWKQDLDLAAEVGANAIRYSTRGGRSTLSTTTLPPPGMSRAGERFETLGR